MNKLLIVCTGNTCRSPMGEHILANLLKESGKSEKYQVSSAGIYTENGLRASSNSEEAMLEIGIDISGHSSRRLTPEDIESAEKIYVMTHGHKEAILKYFINNNKNKNNNIIILDINDPFGLDIEAYRICRDNMLCFFKKEIKNL